MAGPDDRPAEREEMVRRQVERRGVSDPRVLAAMRAVPRDRFVPPEHRALAYADHPLPIGHGQTISQPYVVAATLEALALPEGRPRVLDVGVGSGYQAALLDEMGCEVWGVELRAPLLDAARRALEETGHGGVRLRLGDGWEGWPEGAPYDGIAVAAAASEVPEALCRQLRVGGRLVVPVGGSWHQELLVVERTGPERWRERSLFPVAFVPLVRGGERA